MGLPLKRIDEIEGIRGILSVIVLLGHIKISWLPWFWGCMEVFFAISGYLMGRIALQQASATNFWSIYLARRVLRIWPLYFSVLVFSCVVDFADSHLLGLPGHGLGWGAVKSWFFLQNTEFYVRLYPLLQQIPGYPTMFGHAWSVAMEEHFYLIAPFLAWGLYRLAGGIFGKSPAYAVVALSFFLFCCVMLRIYGLSWWVLLGRMDAFVLGTLVAVMEQRSLGLPLRQRSNLRRLANNSFGVALVGVLLLIASYYFAPVRNPGPFFLYEWQQTAGLSIFALFAASLIAVIALHGMPSATAWLRLAPLQYLGRISYSTYLWQIPILHLLGHVFDRAPFVPNGCGIHAAVIIVIVFGVSRFSYKLIEQPMLKKKPAFEYELGGQPNSSRVNKPC